MSPKNTNKEALLEYIKDACDYCTDYQLPELGFELNHHGEPDVALFDFTSMFAASNSSYVKEKHGKQLLLTLVGDGLLEVSFSNVFDAKKIIDLFLQPFWPTGSGAARGFLGCMDACYMMQEWCKGHKSVLEILAERESIFRLLPQTTSENIAKDYKNYTVDPTTRYPNLNKYLYANHQMAFLYVSDDESKAEIPRRNYTPSCNEIATHVPSFSSRPMVRQPQRNRAGSLDYYDDSEASSGSPQIEHRDLKSRMKALMEAANGGNKTDDVEQYMSNRSKVRDQSSNRPINKAQAVAASNANDRNSKVDRKMAMEKISQTFGYGENAKPERHSLMSAKDRQAENRRQDRAAKAAAPIQKQNTLPEISRPKQSTKVQSATKTKSNKPNSNKGGVKKWDFNQNKPKSRGSGLDDSIDPELDSMLAELEMDEDFKKLSDNDQLTWLESLFYLDTPTKMASSKLVKPKPAEELPKRREKSALSLYSRPSEESDGVSAKTFTVQGANKRSSAAATKQAVQNMPKPAAEPVSAESSFSGSNREGGLNKDMCSLAQSFFSTDKPKKPPQRRVSTNTRPTPEHQVASADRKSYPQTQERAFYQPEGQMVDEDEDDDIPLPTGFQFNRSNSQRDSPMMTKRASPPQEEGAPPIPVRSGEPKLMMLKLMKNATNALKS